MRKREAASPPPSLGPPPSAPSFRHLPSPYSPRSGCRKSAAWPRKTPQSPGCRRCRRPPGPTPAPADRRAGHCSSTPAPPSRPSGTCRHWCGSRRCSSTCRSPSARSLGAPSCTAVVLLRCLSSGAARRLAVARCSSLSRSSSRSAPSFCQASVSLLGRRGMGLRRKGNAMSVGDGSVVDVSVSKSQCARGLQFVLWGSFGGAMGCN